MPETETETKPAATVPVEEHLKLVTDLAARADTAHRDHIAALEARINAPPATREVDPVELSETQLQSMVDDGRITDAQMQERLRVRERAALEKRQDEKIAAVMSESEHRRFLADEIKRYEESHPTAFDRAATTADRQRVGEAYRDIVRIDGRAPQAGSLEEKKLELKALRQAFGPAKRPKETTTETRESTQETGGAGGGTERNVDVWNKIPARYRDYYKHKIALGQYTGFDDPKLKAEMQYMRKGA